MDEHDASYLCIEKLINAVQSIKESLTCGVCMDIFKEPVTLKCGHKFCKSCIVTVIENDHACCPFCNIKIQRRSIPKKGNEILQSCVDHFNYLVQAITDDSGINVLKPYPKVKNTKESVALAPININSKIEEASVASKASSSSTNQKSKSRKNSQASKKLHVPKKNPNSGKKSNDNTLYKYLASTSKCTNQLEDKIKSWLQNVNPNVPDDGEFNDEMVSSTNLKPNENHENQLKTQEEEQFASIRKTTNSTVQDIELSQESKYKETQIRVQESEMFAKKNKPNKNISDKTVLKTPLTVPAVSHSDAYDWRRMKKVGKEMQAKTFKSLSVSFEKGSHTVALDDTVPCNSTNNDSKNIFEESDKNNHLSNNDSYVDKKILSSKRNNFKEKTVSKSKTKNYNCRNYYSDSINSSQVENMSISNIDAKQIDEIIGISPVLNNFNSPEKARNTSHLSNKDSISKINQLSLLKINADQAISDNDISNDELTNFQMKIDVDVHNSPSSQMKIKLKKEVNSSTSLKSIHSQPDKSKKLSEIENITEDSISPAVMKSRLSLRLPNIKTNENSLNQNMSKLSFCESNKKSQFSHRPLIIFKKLGKICKRRKNIPFYYIGKMKPKQIVNNIRITSDIPVNIHYRPVMRNVNTELNEQKSFKDVHINNEVKMLSPEEDSQLKFLAIETPFEEHNTSKQTDIIENEDEPLDYNSSHLKSMENDISLDNLKKISKAQLDFQNEGCNNENLQENINLFERTKVCQPKTNSLNENLEITNTTILEKDNVKEIHQQELYANTSTNNKNCDSEISEKNENLSPVTMEVDRLHESPIYINSSTNNEMYTESNSTYNEVDYPNVRLTKQEICNVNTESESNVDSESSSTDVPKNWKKTRKNNTISRNIINSPTSSPLKKKRTHSESSNDDDDVLSIIDKWSTEPVRVEEPLIKRSKTNHNPTRTLDLNQSEIKCSYSEEIIPNNTLNNVKTKQLESDTYEKDPPIDDVIDRMKNFKENDTCPEKLNGMPSSLISADLFESNEQHVQSSAPISPKITNSIVSVDSSVNTWSPYKNESKEILDSSKNSTDGTIVHLLQCNEKNCTPSEASEGSNKENKSASNILPIKKRSIIRNEEDCIKGSPNNTSKIVKTIAVTNPDDSYHISDSLMDITQEQIAMKKIEKALIGADLSVIHNDKNEKVCDSKDITTPRKKVKSLNNSDVDSIGATPVSKRRQYNFSTSKSATKLEKHTSQISSPQNNFNLIPAVTPVKNTKSYPLSHSTPMLDISTPDTKSSKRKKMTIICSGLVQENTKLVHHFAKKFKANFQNNFNKSVSHVIVQTDSETKAGHKTFKYIQGVAFKKYVISIQWVIDCLQENRLLDENNEKYDVLDPDIFESGSKKSQASIQDIFENFAFFCLEPFNSFTLNEFKDILLYNGGTIASSITELSMQKNRYRIVILESESLSQEQLSTLKTSKSILVSFEWVIDCISQFQILPLTPYLYESSAEEALLLGFPPELLVEEDTVEEED